MAINVFFIVLAVIYTLFALYNIKRGKDKHYYLGLFFILLIIPLITYLPFLRVSKESLQNKNMEARLEREIKTLQKDYKSSSNGNFIHNDNIYEGFYEFITKDRASLNNIDSLIKRLGNPLKVNNLRGDNIDINNSLKDKNYVIAHLSTPFYNEEYILLYGIDQNMRYKIYIPKSNYLSSKIYNEEILGNIDYYWVVKK